jgi:hypothetical protein
MAKAVKKSKKQVEESQNLYEVKESFLTSKREYKKGDMIELTTQGQVDYLRSINKI